MPMARRRTICDRRYRPSLIDRKEFCVLSVCGGGRIAAAPSFSTMGFPLQESATRTDASRANGDRGDCGRRRFLGFAGAAASAALAGAALGAMSSDSARRAAGPARTFDPALLCRPQTAVALQARSAKRFQSRRQP